jgi:hypothetical protein
MAVSEAATANNGPVFGLKMTNFESYNLNGLVRLFLRYESA